jgi:phosphotransferase system, enzyme I, PtsP
MAEPETAQARLDKIVMIIAANMVAEVCSIYVMRPGEVLELYASEGLKSEAVHKSKLKGVKVWWA